MFDGFFKPRFYNKCKSVLKLAKTRLEGAKRKKLAVCKYLKNDIADLLRNALDYNAYGRAEGLINENRRLSIYDFIERCFECVSANLRLLLRNSECPEECRESIASLMYAAARVSEVPELQKLRSLFTERYGNSLELYVNPEFVEKFKAYTPSKETKLQLMRDIAQEYSIDWDSKALEQMLFTPAQHAHVKHKSEYGEHKEEALWDDGGDRASRAEPVRVHGSSGAMNDSPSADSVLPGGISEDETCYTKPSNHKFMPPPYMKPPFGKDERVPKDDAKSSIDQWHAEDNPHAKDRSVPRSVRRRLPRPPPSELEHRKDNQEKAKGGYGASLSGETDDEEMIDDLLLHYSKKKSPYQPVNNLDVNLKPPRSWPKTDEGAFSNHTRSGPLEPTVTTEERKGHVRTSSWHPGSSGNHVHSKLPPDYDEVAARLAALRQR